VTEFVEADAFVIVTVWLVLMLLANGCTGGFGQMGCSDASSCVTVADDPAANTQCTAFGSYYASNNNSGKEVIATIEGRGVYSKLKYESGVHRVQRVPATEASGRVHTSTVTVAVLPEAEEVDVQINDKDLRIDTFCSSGPGGQSVNTTYSAIRITHLPTGLVVQCQDEKSQHKNKAKALRVLRSRLLDIARQEQHDSIAKDRRTQIGSGDRSEKIRTYNFPQSRVSDHRINLTLHQIESILDGSLDPLIDPLVSYHQGERLKAEAAVGSSSPPRIPSTP